MNSINTRSKHVLLYLIKGGDIAVEKKWFFIWFKMDAADVVALVVGIGMVVVLALGGVGWYLRRDTNKA